MTTIYLLRHAQTTFNKEGKMQGRKNNELDEEGLKQSNEFRKKFKDYKVDVCYSSPLIRTMQTAFTSIGDRCPLITDDRLIERDMGELEGQLRSRYDINKFWDYKLNCGDYKVEKIQDIYKRSESFLNYILEKYPNKKILIVSHGAVIRCMHNILNKKNKKQFLDVDIPNCYFEIINI